MRRTGWVIATLLIGSVPAAGGASEGSPATRVDAAIRRLDAGGIANAVRAAAMLAEVRPDVPRLTGAPVPAGLSSELAAPVARLLAAIDAAGAEASAAIRDPEAVRERGSALSDLLVRAATSPPDPDATAELRRIERRGRASVDLPRLFGAGVLLADAIEAALPELRSVETLGSRDDAGCDILDQAPHLCIGGSGPNVYSAEAALVIDLGGNDLHTHSAGAGTQARPASVTIDLGGHDRYERSTGPAQGAGNLGIGMLVDTGGNDTYAIAATAGQESAIGQGTNFSAGGGMLVDLGGRDRYLLTSTKPDQAFAAGQGRAAQPGFGILLDDGADEDEYVLSARPSAVIEGDDEVKLGGLNANGMAFGALGGVGLIRDGGGSDFMTLETVSATIDPHETRPVTSVPLTGPQGLGGSSNGVGLLRAGVGSTNRRAIGSMQAPWSGIQTVNAFGWSVGGLGVLRDEGGDDIYRAEAVSHASRTIALDDACGCDGASAEAKQSIPGVGAASVRGMG
ncbi:MAG TPA: hypothetical protein VM638_09150, partial [Actinomycetota bacterium]|nr:hypothetical protein [Actinomycetota bacterium]